jgi:hypothetical protein
VNEGRGEWTSAARRVQENRKEIPLAAGQETLSDRDRNFLRLSVEISRNDLLS